MRSLLLVTAIALVGGCGGHRAPAPEPAPQNAMPAVVAAPDAAAPEAATPAWAGCCSGGQWACDRMPAAGEDCSELVGGCCLGRGQWVCDRLPEPGECP